MFYVTKYFAKSKNIKQSESRVYFISNNLLSEKFTDAVNRKTGEVQYKRISNIKRTYNYSEMPINNLFEKYPSLVVTYQNEYTTGFKIATTKDFNLFCKDFLYKIFHLPDDNKSMLTG